MQPKVIELFQKIGQSQIVFDAIKKVKNETQLSECQERIDNSTLKDMTESGCSLSATDKLIFNRLKTEITELSSKFSNNVLDSTKEFKLFITNKDDLIGLPPSTLRLLSAQAKAQAQVQGRPGDSRDSGEAAETDGECEDNRWLLTLDGPCFLPHAAPPGSSHQT